MLGRNHKLYSTILPQKTNQNTLAPCAHLLCQWFTSSVILYSLSRKEIQNIWDNFHVSSKVSWVIHLWINVGSRGLLRFWGLFSFLSLFMKSYLQVTGNLFSEKAVLHIYEKNFSYPHSLGKDFFYSLKYKNSSEDYVFSGHISWHDRSESGSLYTIPPYSISITRVTSIPGKKNKK